MMAIAIGMRLILSIAIVAMNDSSTSVNPNIPVSTSTCFYQMNRILLFNFAYHLISLHKRIRAKVVFMY